MRANNSSDSRVWLGMFQQLPLPAVSRYLAQQGWEWIILDMQHGAFNFETAYECIHTIRAHGAKPFVRVPVGSPGEIQKVLDLGALGVVVPMVNSRQESEDAARAAKYPPLGGRSRGGDLTYQYGEGYTERANQDTLLLVQIEHVDAVRSVEEILAVDGVDGCLMGQVDLAMSMGLGHRNFHGNSEHRAAIQRSVDACLKLGKLACYNAYSVAEAQERIHQGFRGITLRSDVDLFVEKAHQILAELHESFPRQRQVLWTLIVRGEDAMADYQMLVGGEWVTGAEQMPVLNPATEQVLANVPVASDRDVQTALQRAVEAQRGWSRLTGVQRGNVLRRWSTLIDQQKEHLAQILSQEEGKPLSEARGEIDFGRSWIDYYAEFDRRIEGDIVAADKPNEQMWIVPQPVGVVVGIIPWNYPSALTIRKVAPALITGNAIVLKPHEDTPLSALELAKLATGAGVPPGVLSVITGPGETVGEALVKSPIPRLVTFTGSAETGKRIMRTASDTVKMVSLEMGGKAPFVVMDDADIDAAVKTAIAARFVNCGQVCICNERTYVHKRIATQFLSRFVDGVRKLKLGNPLDEGTEIGPKVNRQELEKVERYVEEARRNGAEVVTGGKRPSGGAFSNGYWYEPTVVTNVRQDMPIMQEEVFGPVIPIMEFSDFEEGLKFANDSRYGLAAYLFTNDMNRVLRAVRDMECGEIYINRGPGESIHGFHSGWKQSGIGGDDGKYGLEHYLQRKTVYIRYQG